MPDHDPRVQRAAEVLLRDYDSQYDAAHLTWRDFADLAAEVLKAADSEPQPGMDQIRAYMTATGWKPDPFPGTAGELWHRDGWPRGIGVAFESEPGSLECRSVITRLSWAEERGEPEIVADIMAGNGKAQPEGASQ